MTGVPDELLSVSLAHIRGVPESEPGNYDEYRDDDSTLASGGSGDDGDDDPSGEPPQRGIDERPARATATMAATVALVTVAALGVLAGFGPATALGVLAAVSLAAGAWALDEEALARRAGGSVLATTGAASLFGAVVLGGLDGGGLFVLAGTLGLALLAVDLSAGIDRDRRGTISESLRQSGNVVLLGIVGTAVLHAVVVYGVLTSLVVGTAAVATPNALFGLVTLQAFAIGVGLLLPRAVAALDEWVPGDASDADGVLDSMDSVGITTGDVPRAYWGLLAFQFTAALIAQARALFDLFFGPVLGPVLTSGVLHGLLLVAGGLLATVVGASVLQTWVVGWFGDDPGGTLAAQAGGVVAVVVSVVASVVIELLDVELLDGAVTGQSSVVGLPAIALGGLALVLLTVIVLLNAVTFVSEFGVLPTPASGLAFGTALVFVAVLRSVAHGVPAVALFLGVAAVLLIWDVGSHATSVGWQLGRAASTHAAEFVHAGASTLVLGAGAGLAALAYYVIVPAVAPAGTRETAGAATLSLVLVLVAVHAIVIAATLRRRATRE